MGHKLLDVQWKFYLLKPKRWATVMSAALVKCFTRQGFHYVDDDDVKM